MAAHTKVAAIAAKDVIVPVQPGITAATGLLVTDLQYEYTHSTLLILDKASKGEFAKANIALDELFARANQQLDADGIEPKRRRFRQIAECRYAGQGFELRLGGGVEIDRRGRSGRRL